MHIISLAISSLGTLILVQLINADVVPGAFGIKSQTRISRANAKVYMNYEKLADTENYKL